MKKKKRAAKGDMGDENVSGNYDLGRNQKKKKNKRKNIDNESDKDSSVDKILAQVKENKKFPKKTKANVNVRHIALPCSSNRPLLIRDIISCYSSEGPTVIFTETKDSASDIAHFLPSAIALLEELEMGEHESALENFMSGKTKTLVATHDDSPRLRINNVVLVIQCGLPPFKMEKYIRRCERIGREGSTLVSVMVYDPSRVNIFKIERESSIKFEHAAAPQPRIDVNTVGFDAVEAANSLSLLGSLKDYVTVQFHHNQPCYTPSYVLHILRKCLAEDKVESVRGLILTADGNGAVFDVPNQHVNLFVVGARNAAGVSLEVLKALPALANEDNVNTDLDVVED